MIKLFDKSYCIKIALLNKNPYVALAARDLSDDFARVSTRGVKAEICDKAEDGCIVICENTRSTARPVLDEGFSITTENGSIYLKADGYLGTMWAIYTFCEKYLGVDPCYIFNDLETAKRDSLEIDEINLTDKPSGYGFRGVFINDEDLLTGWIKSGTYRNMDYPYYHEVVAPEAMEKIAETVLRLKLNLIIPASFLNADNPPEKTLADVCAERGIYVSQHHLEPVGVSGFTFKNYCERFGKTGEFSYIKNPDLMEEMWRYYGKIWAKYPNVVWQIGLRGLADRPIWEEDTKPNDEKLREYGKFISDAYSKQKEIILEATNGKAQYFTSTLWMEGSLLAQKDAVQFPQNVTVIFADNGPNQMYGPDFHTVPRKDGTTYGIYYHVQYWDYGPHMAPMTGIDKLHYNLKKAYDKGDNTYCILNSSSFREFTFELGAYGSMMWNMEGFDKQAYYEEYGKAFGEHKDAVTQAVKKYFDSVATLPNKSLTKHHGKYFNYNIDEIADGVKNCVIKDCFALRHGNMLVSGINKPLCEEVHNEIYEAIKKAVPKYEQLFSELDGIVKKLPDAQALHVKTKWQNYCSIMLNLYKWYTFVYEAKKCYDERNLTEYGDKVKLAVQSLEALLDFRKCAEYGVFENWYRGDDKMNLITALEKTKKLAQIQ